MIAAARTGILDMVKRRTKSRCCGGCGTRNHQGFGNELINPGQRCLGRDPAPFADRLGELLRYYHCAA
jgi:hypothetical protein